MHVSNYVQIICCGGVNVMLYFVHGGISQIKTIKIAKYAWIYNQGNVYTLSAGPTES